MTEGLRMGGNSALPQRSALVAIGLLWCGIAASSAAADHSAADVRGAIESDLKALAAVRDDLAAKLDQRIAAAAAGKPAYDLRLRLDEGADRDELHLVLPQRAGGWVKPYAVVPFWRQEVAKEKFKLLHQQSFSVPFDRQRYPVGTSSLAMDSKSVRGSIEVTLGLDQLWDERFPADGPLALPNSGEKFSWYDIPREVGHRQLRKQNFAISAEILDGTHEFELYFQRAYNNGPLHIVFQVPCQRWQRAEVRTPAFNLGWHQADVSGLAYKDGRLTGTAKLTIAPDGFVPKNLEPRPVSLVIDGRVDGGRFTGRYRIAGKLTYTDDDGEAVGDISGTAGAVVLGRYRASGELGEYQGTIGGTVHQPPATCRGMLAPAGGGLPADVDSAAREAMARAVRLYQEIRALKVAFTEYPCPLSGAFAGVGALTVDMDAGKDAPTAAALELTKSYVTRLRALVEDAAKRTSFVALTCAADPNFGPFFGAEPLAVDVNHRAVLPPAGSPAAAQRWQFVPTWNTLGPFYQREGLDHNAAELPDLVPAAKGMWRQAQSPFGSSPGADTLRWTDVAATSGKLVPPWVRPAWSLGWNDQLWYAAAEVEADADREVWISVAAVGPAKLWVNDHLAWVGPEHEFVFRDRQEEIFKLSLRKGANRLLLRVRNDHDTTWARVHFARLGRRGTRQGLQLRPPRPRPLRRQSNRLWHGTWPRASTSAGGCRWATGRAPSSPAHGCSRVATLMSCIASTPTPERNSGQPK